MCQAFVSRLPRRPGRGMILAKSTPTPGETACGAFSQVRLIPWSQCRQRLRPWRILGFRTGSPDRKSCASPQTDWQTFAGLRIETRRMESMAVLPVRCELVWAMISAAKSSLSRIYSWLSCVPARRRLRFGGFRSPSCGVEFAAIRDAIFVSPNGVAILADDQRP